MKVNNTNLPGQELVADFQAAFIAMATSEMANYEAQKSENDLLQQLSYWSRGGYLNPRAIQSEQQDSVSRASLDAHIKKLQASQVEQMKKEHLHSLVKASKATYIGKRVRIEVLRANQDPIDVLWANPQTGYRANALNKTHLSGKIMEVRLESNLLMIYPSRISRVVNKELQAYIIYVIDPQTAEPMVSVSFA